MVEATLSKEELTLYSPREFVGAQVTVKTAWRFLGETRKAG